MKTKLLLLLFLPFLGSSAWADRIQVLAINPQKTLEFQRRQTRANDGGDPQFIDFVDLKARKILFSFSSIWRSTDGGWSPDGSSACVNDRTATSGDFLYLFRMIGAQLKALRTPGDDGLHADLSRVYSRRSDSGRFTLTARQWLTNDSLEVRVTGGGYGDESADFDATIKIERSGAVSFDPHSMTGIK